MKIKLQNAIPAVILTLLVLIFFSSFFQPTPKILFTPDFGQSDVWNLNYPLKENLSKHLKIGEIPIWSDEIGTGFPIFAEGQTGTLNIINLFLFKFFPTWLAFNLGYVTIFLTTAFSTYWYCRVIHFSKIQSLWSAIAFTFSGVFVARLQHFNLIQTASFLPLIFALTELTIQKKRLREPLLLAIILSQQYFSGFPQVTFITLFGISIYSILRIYFDKRQFRKIILLLSISFILFLGLSAIQILPTKEFLDLSARESGLSFSEATRFPYPIKHLLTFISPFLYGNPAMGTYPVFNENWGIFWENTAYVGILPILFIVWTLVKSSVQKNKLMVIFLTLIIISIILSLGKNSPFYLLYTIFPFNLFRVPSRFLILTAFSISILSAYPLEYFISKVKYLPQKYLIFSFLPILIFQLMLFGNNFKPLGKVEDWLIKPETAQILEKFPINRIYSIPSYSNWNQEFLKNGWQKEDMYYFSRNNLMANSNIIYGIESINVYPIITSRRFKIVNNEIEKGITINSLINETSVSVNSISILENNNVTILISPHKITSNKFYEMNKVTSPDKSMTYYLYQLKNTLPKFRTIQKFIIAKSIGELVTKIGNTDYEKEVVLENNPSTLIPNTNMSSIKIISNKETTKRLDVETKENTILISSYSFYPGWEAKVDGIKTEIYPANINQQAIIIPSGKHKIEFYYNPKSVFIGKIISFSSMVIITILLLFNKLKLFKRPFFRRFYIFE